MARFCLFIDTNRLFYGPQPQPKETPKIAKFLRHSHPTTKAEATFFAFQSFSSDSAYLSHKTATFSRSATHQTAEIDHVLRTPKIAKLCASRPSPNENHCFTQQSHHLKPLLNPFRFLTKLCLFIAKKWPNFTVLQPSPSKSPLPPSFTYLRP